jgi:hypothetical protein
MDLVCSMVLLVICSCITKKQATTILRPKSFCVSSRGGSGGPIRIYIQIYRKSNSMNCSLISWPIDSYRADHKEKAKTRRPTSSWVHVWSQGSGVLSYDIMSVQESADPWQKLSGNDVLTCFGMHPLSQDSGVSSCHGNGTGFVQCG